MKTILIIGAIGLLLWMIRGNWQDEDPDGAAGALLLFVGSRNWDHECFFCDRQ